MNNQNFNFIFTSWFLLTTGMIIHRKLGKSLAWIMFQAIGLKKINSDVTPRHQLNELKWFICSCWIRFLCLSYQLCNKIVVWPQWENCLANWPNILQNSACYNVLFLFTVRKSKDLVYTKWNKKYLGQLKAIREVEIKKKLKY